MRTEGGTASVRRAHRWRTGTLLIAHGSLLIGSVKSCAMSNEP